MDSMINFGIDLGTTNSLIAKFVKGNVEVFRNPIGLKDTLPSVVCFRKDRIVVGDKAREYLERDPKGTVGRFKRKMGTSESFKIKAIDQSQSPIELSAYVLKELKSFVHTSENVDAAVITIPASFDMIQSNATKEAGQKAGFKHVVLLQEPIAASLAYANKRKERDLKNSQWLVYDLGGGTFDVALVKIQNGEMKIVDHEGDNFLGGMDFDDKIVDELIVPHLERECQFEELSKNLKSESGRHNALYYKLLHKAENAKIVLSSKTSTEIELDSVKDDGDESHDLAPTITRSEFENLIKPDIDRTADMIKTILTRNSLRPSDLQFVLMVGGSTYIPYVRKRIEELLEIPVNCEIEPTTAVVIGAAYFAGTKEKKVEAESSLEPKSGLRIRMAYPRASNEMEEIFSARVEGDVAGLGYRIVRSDGGYDSGVKPLTARINEDLPLAENEYNLFKFTVYDQEGNVVPTDTSMIQIAHNQFGIAGQPLPEDICVECDDLDNDTTKLKVLIRKNTILPAKATHEFIASRSIAKGSDDEIRIGVLEGPEYVLPAANRRVGALVITGKQIERDIIKGTSIDFSVEMSESRDLTATAYVTLTDQEFRTKFDPQNRDVPTGHLTQEIDILQSQLDQELAEATKREDYEVAKDLQNLQQRMDDLVGEAMVLSKDDVTDSRYQLEDKKRKLAEEIYNATKEKRIAELRIQYSNEKSACLKVINENGNDQERRMFDDIVSQERVILSSSNPQRLRDEIDKLVTLRYSILWRTPSFLIGMFNHLVEKRQKFNDQSQAKSLIDAGKLAIESENFDRLADINNRFLDLLPRSEAKQVKALTGIA